MLWPSPQQPSGGSSTVAASAAVGEEEKGEEERAVCVASRRVPSVRAHGVIWHLLRSSGQSAGIAQQRRAEWNRSLQELWFGNDFNQPVDVGFFCPDSLKFVSFGKTFNQSPSPE